MIRAVRWHRLVHRLARNPTLKDTARTILEPLRALLREVLHTAAWAILIAAFAIVLPFTAGYIAGWAVAGFRAGLCASGGC